MAHQVKLKDLVEGGKYRLVGPVKVTGQQEAADKLMAAPHSLISSELGLLRFLPNEEDRQVNYFNESNNENYVPPEVEYLDISMANLPDGENQLFETIQKSVRNITENKAKNQALRNVYEKGTGTSATPGEGSANIIRRFIGMSAPKGAMGGRRTSKRSKRTMRNKKSKSRNNKKSLTRRSRR